MFGGNKEIRKMNLTKHIDSRVSPLSLERCIWFSYEL